jgi:phage gp29-like protein
MPELVDLYGRPIRRQALPRPQTAQLGQLRREWDGHPSKGLTPPRLASILLGAERGDLVDQLDLAEDMEEADAHLAAELAKRRRALQTIPWDVLPPRDASARERNAAAALQRLLAELTDLEDLLFDLGDAILKGFSCVELEWTRDGTSWLPAAFHYRPSRWFTTAEDDRDALRLRDPTGKGLELQPFGWITHVHKAKSGYVARTGLTRVLAWPYLFKSYGLRDLSELLDIYGLPLRLGVYQEGASSEQRATLLQAVMGIGHHAAGIIPEGMRIDFQQAAQGSHEPFALLLDWADRAESKAILGQVLSAEAKSTGLGSGVADLHGEVRHDLLLADARQVASTLTRDLVYPLYVLNLNGDPRRLPRFVFETDEPEDLALYADALPKLVSIGARIPIAWAQERLGIPLPEGDEPVLGAPAPEPAEPPQPPPGTGATRLAAAARGEAADEPEEAMVEQLASAGDAAVAEWLAQLRAMLDTAESLEEFRARLEAAFPDLAPTRLVTAMAQAYAAAHLAGMSDVADEAG